MSDAAALDALPDTGLDVALIQVASGLDPEENRARLADLVPTDTDLAVLPEAYARDFGKPDSPLGPHAEPVDGPFGTEVSRVASAAGASVLAGMFERSPDPERPWNTLLLRGEAEAAYRKIHLYDSFGYRESDRLVVGEIEPLVVQVGGWRLGLMTCYDLRFPELARALVAAGAEALVVPTAWMAGPRKVDHWRTLVRARAIENTVYVLGAAQPGPRYTGHSMVVDPWGEVVVEATEAEEETVRARLDPTLLEEARSTNPSLANRRM